MQQRLNTKATQRTAEHAVKSDAKVRKKAESAAGLTQIHSSVQAISCKIGDGACAARHASVIQNSDLIHPTNSSQRIRTFLTLQRKYGNRFVRQVISSSIGQPKLVIGSPDDIYEQEADKIAERIMRKPEDEGCCPLEMEQGEEPIQTKSLDTRSVPLIRRQEEDEDEEVLAQASYQASTEKSFLDRDIDIGSLASSGRPLPNSTRAFFESRFGHDFGHVRIHTDSHSADYARSFNARAFTIGSNIVFGPGHYSSESRSGRRLIAHELTHVLQQTGSGSRLGHGSGVVRQSFTNKAAKNKMIPGYVERHLAPPRPTTEQGIIQFDKIDHRTLKWADFKKKPPEISAYSASTKSNFHTPEWDKIKPEKLEAKDTGKNCKIGTKDDKKFKVDIRIDPSKINVKPYMWQEESWAMKWTTDPKAQEKKCRDKLVKKCNEDFDKAFRKIEKKRKEEVGKCKTYMAKGLSLITKQSIAVKQDCEKSFKENNSFWSINIHGKTLKATNRAECSNKIYNKYRALRIKKEIAYSYKTAVAKTKAECSTTFSKKYVELAKKSLKLKFGFRSADKQLTSSQVIAKEKKDCGKKILNECKSKLIIEASNYLLKHEQGHFDITKIMAQKVQESMRSLVNTFTKEITECGRKRALGKAKKILNRNMKNLKKKYKEGKSKLKNTQDSYDAQTGHSGILTVQKTWEKEIGKKLPEIKIK